MIDTNFERNTTTDHLLNAIDESVRFADMIRNAISNDFIIKYNNFTDISLGFYYSKNLKNKDGIPIEITHYFFLENSDFEYYKAMRKNNDKYLESWLLNKSFFKHYNLPKNKDFYLIWRVEVCLDKQLHKTYDQKIKFVYRK